MIFLLEIEFHMSLSFLLRTGLSPGKVIRAASNHSWAKHCTLQYMRWKYVPMYGSFSHNNMYIEWDRESTSLRFHTVLHKERISSRTKILALQMNPDIIPRLLCKRFKPIQNVMDGLELGGVSNMVQVLRLRKSCARWVAKRRRPYSNYIVEQFTVWKFRQSEQRNDRKKLYGIVNVFFKGFSRWDCSALMTIRTFARSA